jgi:hypothetical protein
LALAKVLADHGDDPHIGNKLAVSEKYVAAPPRQRSRRPVGVSIVSKVTLSTTVKALSFLTN